jgi:hypothetical protein
MLRSVAAAPLVKLILLKTVTELPETVLAVAPANVIVPALAAKVPLFTKFPLIVMIPEKAVNEPET